MSGGINLATKMANYVDEKFYPRCQAGLVLSKDFEFLSERTVQIFSVPNVPLNNYLRNSSNRYGNPMDLARNIQTEVVSQDKAFTFVIDKGDMVQSAGLMNVGKAIDSELKNVVGPAFDSYCFHKWAQTAVDNGGSATSSISKTNAYLSLLSGIQYLRNNHTPLAGTYAFCSYGYISLLMQDSTFIKYGERSEERLEKGIIGECAGIQIVEVAADLLPAGTAFLLVSKECSVAPVQINETKYNEDPPGISGYLVEGRILYDCFVFNSKVKSIYFHGGQAVFKPLNVETAATDIGKTTVVIHAEKEATANKWYYDTAAAISGLEAVTFGTAITTANWTQLTAVATEITPTSGHKYIRVIEVDSADKPIAKADVLINVGIS